MHFDYLGDHFALIDMPGGTGFAADGLAALQSADMAHGGDRSRSGARAMLAEPMLRRLDALAFRMRFSSTRSSLRLPEQSAS